MAKIKAKPGTAELGKALLNLFRDEQEKHGSTACRCNVCEEDMAKALERLMAKRHLSIAEHR